VNLAKIPEYTAPGWVASTERAARDFGFVAATPLDEGIRLTLEWYEGNGWL
jgi:nucleoside-diphosphate-sugar epimerase